MRESLGLSVIVPAYNEAERIGATLDSIQRFLTTKYPQSWELLVVDDGSTDSTVEVAKKHFHHPDSCRVIASPRNKGKGAAIRLGMREARGNFRLFTDADNSTPIEELVKLHHALIQSKAEIAIASRAMRGSRLEVRQPFHREMMGRLFNLLVQAIALPGIQDTQCGFKLFTSRAAEELFPRQKLDRWSFDVEILLMARRRGWRIVEVPVRWIDNPNSRVSPLRDSWRVLIDTLRLRIKGVG
jgi:dolichyl-phosphate beta-glucosyltransferase